MPNAKGKMLQREALKQLLLMSDREFENLVYDALLLLNKDSVKEFRKKNKAHIKKTKKQLNPAEIITKARELAAKTKK